jgi:hypothetical protein
MRVLRETPCFFSARRSEIFEGPRSQSNASAILSSHVKSIAIKLSSLARVEVAWIREAQENYWGIRPVAHYTGERLN